MELGAGEKVDAMRREKREKREEGRGLERRCRPRTRPLGQRFITGTGDAPQLTLLLPRETSRLKRFHTRISRLST